MSALQQARPLVRKLGSARTARHQVNTAQALCQLLGDKGSHSQAIAALPDCLDHLVAMLGSAEVAVHVAALRVLCALAVNCPANLEPVAAGSPQHCPPFLMALAGSPHFCLPRLVHLLHAQDTACQLHAAQLVGLMGVHVPIRVVVAMAPGMLTALLRLVRSGGAQVLVQAMRALVALGVEDCPQTPDAVAAVPGVLQRLAALLGSGDAALVQAQAAAQAAAAQAEALVGLQQLGIGCNEQAQGKCRHRGRCRRWRQRWWLSWRTAMRTCRTRSPPCPAAWRRWRGCCSAGGRACATARQTRWEH